MFLGGGQQERGDPGSTEAAGSPAALIAGVSQTKISQASAPAAGGGCGRKIIQITLLRTSYGGCIPRCIPPRPPVRAPSSPLPPSLPKTPTKPLEGWGEPSTSARPPGSLSSTVPRSCQPPPRLRGRGESGNAPPEPHRLSAEQRQTPAGARRDVPGSRGLRCAAVGSGPAALPNPG